MKTGLLDTVEPSSSPENFDRESNVLDPYLALSDAILTTFQRGWPRYWSSK